MADDRVVPSAGKGLLRAGTTLNVYLLITALFRFLRNFLIGDDTSAHPGVLQNVLSQTAAHSYRTHGGYGMAGLRPPPGMIPEGGDGTAIGGIAAMFREFVYYSLFDALSDSMKQAWGYLWGMVSPLNLLKMTWVDSIHEHSDESYQWLATIWESHPSFKRSRAFFTSSLSRSEPDLDLDGLPLMRGPSSRSVSSRAFATERSFSFRPLKNENMYIWHEGTCFRLTKGPVESDMSSAFDHSFSTRRVNAISLRCYAATRAPLIAFLKHAEEKYNRLRPPLLTCMVWRGSGYDEGWKAASTKTKRQLSSIILDDEGQVAKTLLEDAKDFFKSQNWYNRRGLAWKRGYMFNGPPGAGKSSTIQALASELDMAIYIVPLNSPGMNDVSLGDALRSIPMGSIVVMEDIDVWWSATKSRDLEEQEFRKKIEEGEKERREKRKARRAKKGEEAKRAEEEAGKAKEAAQDKEAMPNGVDGDDSLSKENAAIALGMPNGIPHDDSKTATLPVDSPSASATVTDEHSLPKAFETLAAAITAATHPQPGMFPPPPPPSRFRRHRYSSSAGSSSSSMAYSDGSDYDYDDYGPVGWAPRPPAPPMGSNLSLSAVLNAIDGMESGTGLLLVATTNDLPSLDPALVRPGRMDRFFEFKKSTRVGARRLFDEFYRFEWEDIIDSESDDEYDDEEDEVPAHLRESGETVSDEQAEGTLVKTRHAKLSAKERKEQREREAEAMRVMIQKLAARWSEEIENEEFSTAELQGQLLIHKKSPVEAQAGMREWVAEMRKKREELRKEKEARKAKSAKKGRSRGSRRRRYRARRSGREESEEDSGGESSGSEHPV